MAIIWSRFFQILLFSIIPSFCAVLTVLLGLLILVLYILVVDRLLSPEEKKKEHYDLSPLELDLED